MKEGENTSEVITVHTAASRRRLHAFHTLQTLFYTKNDLNLFLCRINSPKKGNLIHFKSIKCEAGEEPLYIRGLDPYLLLFDLLLTNYTILL